MPVIRFCSQCGASVAQKIPPGDNRLRAVCGQCGFINYQNPRIVTGCLPVYKDQVLLCKRGIEPRKGYWTLPGGFMELGETIEEGAARETVEEALADVEIQSLYTLFNVLPVGQVSVFYLARLNQPEFGAGPESEEVALFREQDIPWDELAFSTIAKTLRHYFEDRKQNIFPLHSDTIAIDEYWVTCNTPDF